MDSQKPTAPTAPENDAATPTPAPAEPAPDPERPPTEASKNNLPTKFTKIAISEAADTSSQAPHSPVQPKESTEWSDTPGADITTKKGDTPPVPDPLLTLDDNPTPAQPATIPTLEGTTEAPAAPLVSGAVAAPKPKKKLWFKALIIGGGAAFLVGAGSVAAYYGYVVPNQPDNILNAALVNSFADESIKSVSFDGMVGVKSAANGMTFNGTFNGKAGADGRLELAGGLDALITKLTLDVRSVDGKSYYFKVGGLTGLPELLGASADSTVKTYASFIKALDGQWLEITQSLMNSFGVDAGGFKPSPADMQKLADIYERHPMLKVSQTLPGEAIKGTASYHYKVIINKTEMKALYTEIKDANIQGLKITQEQVDSLNTMITDIDFNKYPVDVWIAKDSRVINQFSTSLTADGTTFTVKMTLFDFNKPFEVKKPEGAKSLLEVLGGALGASSPDSTIMQELQNSGISL